MVFHALSGGRKEGCLLISSLKQTGLGSELAMVLPQRLFMALSTSSAQS